MAAYQPIPVTEAKSLAEKYGKAFIIVLAYDAERQMTHTTTFGATLPYKHWAAQLGELATSAIGADTSQKQPFEDFRMRREGEYEEAR